MVKAARESDRTYLPLTQQYALRSRFQLLSRPPTAKCLAHALLCAEPYVLRILVLLKSLCEAELRVAFYKSAPFIRTEIEILNTLPLDII